MIPLCCEPLQALKTRLFDPRNIYATLVNPQGRARSDLVEFATATAIKYTTEQCPTAVLMLFTEDFKYREEKQSTTEMNTTRRHK